MTEPAIAVQAIGMIASVGLFAEQVATSVGAGISRIREVDAWQDLDGQPFRGGFLPDGVLAPLNAKVGPVADELATRCLRLAGSALRQLKPQLADLTSEPMAIIGLAAPDHMPDASPVSFFEGLQRQAQIRIRAETSRILTAGRAAGLEAVHQAVTLLRQGHPGPIIAGGVDSYYQQERLYELSRAGRILNQRNLDGFLPGEGAALLLLQSTTTGSGPGGRILATATGFEEGHLYAEAPLRGDGLSDTIRLLFERVPADRRPRPQIYANLNGESLDAKQWGVAMIRNKPCFTEDVLIEHPADCMGDAGAAMGPMMIGLALHALRTGSARGPVLVACAADEGPRAAIYLTTP